MNLTKFTIFYEEIKNTKYNDYSIEYFSKKDDWLLNVVCNGELICINYEETENGYKFIEHYLDVSEKDLDKCIANSFAKIDKISNN